MCIVCPACHQSDTERQLRSLQSPAPSRDVGRAGNELTTREGLHWAQWGNTGVVDGTGPSQWASTGVGEGTGTFTVSKYGG